MRDVQSRMEDRNNFASDTKAEIKGAVARYFLPISIIYSFVIGFRARPGWKAFWEAEAPQWLSIMSLAFAATLFLVTNSPPSVADSVAALLDHWHLGAVKSDRLDLIAPKNENTVCIAGNVKQCQPKS